MELLIGLLVILFFFGLPIWALSVALSASSKSKASAEKINSLESDIAVLRHRIWKMETEGKPSQPEPKKSEPSIDLEEFAAVPPKPVPTAPKSVSPVSLRKIDPSKIELTSPELVPNYEEKIDIAKEPIVAGESFVLNIGGKDVVLEPVSSAPEPAEEIHAPIPVEPIVEGEPFVLNIGGKDVVLEPVESEPEPINISETVPTFETATPNLETTPPNLETTPTNLETTPPNLETTPPNLETTPPNLETTPTNTKTAPTNTKTAPTNTKTAPTNRVFSGESEQSSEPLVFKRSESSKANDSEQLSPFMQWMKTIADTNIFVKIGVGLLFAGLAFFLKYAVDHQLFSIPMEVRVGAVALTGIGLTVLGSRMKTRRTYGLILQGAGMAIFYLTTFAAFKLFGLIGPIPALILMVLTGIVTAALAIKNDERALALIAVIGGFSAPILAPSENPSHVTMFSYYLLVNLAIFGITALRPWWILGTVGFLFTFIISTLWGVTSYDPSKLASTEPFLVIYWIMYLFMALFYEFRQKDSGKTVPASTLLFGVPTVAFSLQILLMKETEYGVSLSVIIASIAYAWVFIGIRNNPKASKALKESIRTIAIVFFTLAFPFALAPVHTSTAWAIEGAVLLTIALKRSRMARTLFGAILQLGAVIFFLVSIPEIGQGNRLFLNSFSFSAIILVLALFYSSYKLRDFKEWILYTTALLLTVGAGIAQIGSFIIDSEQVAAITLYFTILSMLFFVIGNAIRWSWIKNLSFSLVATIFVSSFYLIENGTKLFTLYHGLSIGIALICWYIQLLVSKNGTVEKQFAGKFHSWTILFLTILCTRELWLWVDPLIVTDTARLALFAIIPIAVVLKTLFVPLFPFKTFPQEMKRVVVIPLISVLSVWSIIAFFFDGATTKLAYIPLINPLDSITALVLFAIITVLIRSGKHIEGEIRFAVGQFVSFWIFVMTLRTLCRIIGIEYEFETMVHSPIILSAVVIYLSLEGSRLLTLGLKNPKSAWITSGMFLQLIAVMLFFLAYPVIGSGDTFLKNPYTITALVVSISMLYSSFRVRMMERFEEFILFYGAVLLIALTGMSQISHHILVEYEPAVMTLFYLLIPALFFGLGKLLEWNRSESMAILVIPTVLVSSYTIFSTDYALSGSTQGAVIVGGIVLLYLLMNFSSRSMFLKTKESRIHPSIVLYLTVMLTRELWLAVGPSLETESARLAVLAVVPLATLLMTLYLQIFPFSRYRDEMESIVAKPIAWLFLIWSAAAFCADGSTGIRYIPLINPLDLIQVLALLGTIVVIKRFGYEIRGKISFAISLFVFLWVMVMTLRTTCGIGGIPYELSTMVNSTVIQAVVTIYSALYGTAYMIAGSKRGRRSYWIAGASLLGFVTIKLISDLVAEQTLPRIITFIVVGLLFMAVGYFSPFPTEKVRGNR